MRQRTSSPFAALALLVTIAAGSALAATITADTADDVCAPAANPCNVTSTVNVVSGSTLDFGSRTVNVTGGGRFDFGSGSASLLCGNFNATTSTAAIVMRATESGFSEGGLVTIEARRSCSGGGRSCIDAADCQLGNCTARRCTLRPSETCTSDAGCQLGTCMANRRCSLRTSTRCLSNSDCDWGTCPTQLTCAGEAQNPVNCAVNADCNFGTCTVGSASIDLNGAVQGNADTPGVLVLRAADNVTVRKTVTLSASDDESDGGEIDIDAASGFCSIQNTLSVTGGGFSSGGAISLSAGTDITLTSDIDAVGGDFDGGAIDFNAGNDVIISKDVNVNAAQGAGLGGEIGIDAGRDVIITGTSGNPTVFSSEGHTDSENTAGDGGTQQLIAGRDMNLGTSTRFEGSGSMPDGFGADLYVDAGRNLTVSGEIEAEAKGADGAGGFIETVAGGAATFAASSLIDLTGGTQGGGLFELLVGGNLTYSGTVDVTAGGGGVGGSVLLASDADMTVGGTLKTQGGIGGAGDGRLEVDACRFTLAATGKVDNKASGGNNVFTSRESMRFLGGSSVTNPSGENILIYRTAAKPPVLSGTMSPNPQLVLDQSLVGCPVCGNSEVDQTETCDDGNLNNGDGCSSTCQLESCIAQTPGYPAVPLCDDGSGCTVDSCNVSTGDCEHEFLCDDGIACTVDSCVDDQCANTPDDGACEDSDPCTTNFCSVVSGCDEVASNEACDDGLFCTVGDVCENFECNGSPRVCDDGIACTVDGCDEGADACVATANHEECTDGVFCNGAEVCDLVAGCQEVDDVDCSHLDTVCGTGACDEDTNECVAVSATNEGSPCDDGLFCTTDDRCQSGECAGDPIDCSDGVACTVDLCDEVADECVRTPDDGACDNGIFCDGAEICDDEAGCESGEAVDCSSEDDACNEGACDEDSNSCVAVPANEGDPCDDEAFCTVADRCQAGICGGDARDCADEFECTVDSCDEDGDSCLHMASDALCSNGLFCDGAETCSADVGCLPGTPADCSFLDSQCEQGVCDEGSDSCEVEPANSGGDCSDEDICTTNDTCIEGHCEGTPIDCSHLDDACHVGTCNVVSGVCEAEPGNEGFDCDDGDECTENDACSGGECLGESIEGCGVVCGDGVQEGDEQCDDGDTTFVPGEYCRANCTRVPCGQPTDVGSVPRAADALFTLRTVVGQLTCDRRVCDPDNNGLIQAADALRLLRIAVGQSLTLNCPLTL